MIIILLLLKEIKRRTVHFEFLKNVITVSEVVDCFNLSPLLPSYDVGNWKLGKNNNTEAFLKAGIRLVAILDFVLGEKSRENFSFHSFSVQVWRSSMAFENIACSLINEK